MQKLTELQNELKAPKNAFNAFGKYKYRNLESILEALKPLLLKHELVFTLTDTIEMVGERYYIKATAVMTDHKGNHHAMAEGWAREALVKKGMDESQITGAASSYARKYAVAALLLLDDTQDADSMEGPKPLTKKQAENYQRMIDETDTDPNMLLKALKADGVNQDNYELAMEKLTQKHAAMQEGK